MALPSYNKANRRKAYEQLPKGAYVIRILNVKDEPNKSGVGHHLTIAFDIAEGEYADFYKKLFNDDQREDKKWPVDATYYVTVPEDGCQAYVMNNWDTFFADLEDSNNGYVFKGNVAELTGKLLGGKFANEQTAYNGNVYNHTKLRWTCVAEDVRTGKAGKMPVDKTLATQERPSAPDDFINIPDNIEEDLPF